MKINLQTRLFPGYYGYNPVVSVSEYRAKKEEEAKKEAEEKAKQELIESLGKIKTFTIGTTPNFTIDLNQDMLQLEDIEQLIVTFGQFGKLVQREILYFSDNYDIKYEIDSEGEYVPLSADIIRDEPHWKRHGERQVADLFNDDIQFLPTGLKDSEGNRLYHWRHPYQTIRNPKFTYNKVFNKLVLTLSQTDTLNHFKPTNWYEPKEEGGEKEQSPYWEGNPSLVMIEVKIKVKNQLDMHLGGQVIIRPQEYYAVADTIEHNLLIPERPINWRDEVNKTAADEIYTIPRFRMYFGDFCKPEYDEPFPTRVEELPFSRLTTMQNLLHTGLKVISKPCYEYDSENNIIMDYTFDSEGIPVEKSRYWCLMLPINIKLKIRDVKIMFGGVSTPGVADNVDYDATGLHFYDNEGNKVYWYQVSCREGLGREWFDDLERPAQPKVVPKPGFWKGESCSFNSLYVVDPDGFTPENPRGEYICWYICSRDTAFGHNTRFFGPGKYRKDQRYEPYYEFLIQFDEVGKAGH